LVQLKPLSWVGGPIILLDSGQLEIQGPTHPLQVVEESFDPALIASSFQGTVSVRLIIEETIIVIVPFTVSFALDAVSLLAPVFNLVVCIFVTNNVAQVPVVPILFFVMLLWRSDAAGRVPTWALAVVRVLTPPLVSMFKGRVNQGGCIQHCFEVFDLCIDLLVVFRQQGDELFDDHP
jgi:hypothetical protein